MPREDGSFKGISVPKLWPGHKDYDPDAELERDEFAWEHFKVALYGKKKSKHD